jgi:hypothetical protein
MPPLSGRDRQTPRQPHTPNPERTDFFGFVHPGEGCDYNGNAVTIQQFLGFAATSAQALHQAVKRDHISMRSMILSSSPRSSQTPRHYGQ